MEEEVELKRGRCERRRFGALTGTERSQFKQMNMGGGGGDWAASRPVKSADACSCAGNINLSLVLRSPSYTPLIYESRPSASKLMAGVSWNHEPALFTSALTAAPHCTIASGSSGYIKPTPHLRVFSLLLLLLLLCLCRPETLPDSQALAMQNQPSFCKRQRLIKLP